jgi:hypothetical protein
MAPYFAAIIPAIGPRITIAFGNGSCRMPTPIASRPKTPYRSRTLSKYRNSLKYQVLEDSK